METLLTAVAEAFEELARGMDTDGGELRLAPFGDTCALVSVLFNSLGIAFKFAESDFSVSRSALKTMAEHLASIFSAQKDRANCPLYFKIGACRHGDRCSRLHNKPTTSPTILLANMYQRPDMIAPGAGAQGQTTIAPEKMQEHFEDFYEDIYEELNKFGEVQALNVCDNLADHMIGNVYVQFRDEEQAVAAHNVLQGRLYSGRPITVEYSHVTDFREATCMQYEESICLRGDYCNFMHVKRVGIGGRSRRSHGRSCSQFTQLVPQEQPDTREPLQIDSFLARLEIDSKKK